jgi:hypothetical protein
MSARTTDYQPLVIGLVATLGIISGVIIASFRFKFPKPPQSG